MKTKKKQSDLINRAKYNQYLENLSLCGIGKRNSLTLSYNEFVKKGKHKLWFLGDIDRIGMDAYKQGEEDAKKRAIEILASVLENWVHGGDADCIIAEFEEKLNNKWYDIKRYSKPIG